jgi:tetratricopeptide (TPR) repeat protein
MRMRNVLLAVLAISVSLPALAGSAKGKVLDTEGKPIVGAIVKITLAAPPKNAYDAKTDKNGGFWFPMLMYTPPGDYEVVVEAEGYFTGKVKAVSRTADRTLLGEFETKIKVGFSKVQVRITGLGEATVDFTLSKEKAPEAAPKAVVAEANPFDVARGRMQTGDFEGAVEAFQKAIQASPEDAERHQLFAYALFRLDRLGEAEAEASKAETLAPEKPGTHLILAEIYKAKGDNEKAWAAILKERALAPENVRVLERVASLGAEMGKLDEAIPAAEAVTRLKPEDPEGWITLGGLYAENKQLDKSEQAFRKVVELDPTNAAQTFYNIGVVLANKPDLSEGDNRKVTEAFRKAVENNPDYAVAHRELAYALLRSGDSEGARKELERYLQLDPKAADAADIQSIVKSLTKKK